MKRFVPLKYILGMCALFLVLPTIAISLLLYFIGVNDVTIAICIFLGVLVISGPFVYFQNLENTSILFEEGRIVNYINDGTANFGWAEEIKKINKIEIADNEKVKKFFKNCKSKKVLLIDFGFNNVKYISLSLFTKNQINGILKCIESCKCQSYKSHS